MNEDDIQNLAIERCDELAVAIYEEAALLPPGSKKDGLLNIADGYRNLAEAKRLVARKLN
jgi:hypothetical protein